MRIRLGGLLIQIESNLVTSDGQPLVRPPRGGWPKGSAPRSPAAIIHIGERALTPVLRYTAIRFMSVGQNAGGGFGFVRASPVGVIERRESGATAQIRNDSIQQDKQIRFIPITDATGNTLRAMLGGAILIGLVLWLIRKRL